MKFEEAYKSWQQGAVTQEEAAQMLGICGRSFRRRVHRYKTGGLVGLADRRIGQGSHRRAPADEVAQLVEYYKYQHQGWDAKQFYGRYRREGGGRSYTWVKSRLQDAQLLPKAARRGGRRKSRERSPMPGMLLYQGSCLHEWVAGQQWALIVTVDDATNEHYSLFFVEQEDVISCFQGVWDVIDAYGLFGAFCMGENSDSDLGKTDPEQLGRAMQQLGIDLLAACPLEIQQRFRSAIATHQERLPEALALAGVVELTAANHYLRDVYRSAFNAEFVQPSLAEGTAFVPFIGGMGLDDILCEQFERIVDKNNSVRFEGLALQIPVDRHRLHYVKTKVRVHRYINGTLAVFHGPRKLAKYDVQGRIEKMGVGFV